MAVNLQINVDPSGAEEGFRKVGQAAEEAANAAEKASDRSGVAAIKVLDEQIDRVRELTQGVKELSREREHATASATRAAGELQQAEEQAAKTAKEAAEAHEAARRRSAEAATQFAEGIGKFAEAYQKTGDLREAVGAVEGQMVAAMAAINPMAGALTAAALAAFKLWENFSGAKEAAEKAAEATARIKAEAATVNRMLTEGVTEAVKMAASFNNVDEASAGVKAVEAELERIAETRKIINGLVGKVPEALGMELMNQKGLLTVEEQKLQLQHMILRNRHEQIAETRTLWDYDREAAKEAQKAIAKIREEAKATAVERMSKEYERARAEKKNSEEQSQLDQDFERELQKLVDETAAKVKEHFKLYRKDNEERQKLLDRLKQAEEKLESHREKMHENALARIKEQEAKEDEARQRKIAAENEMQNGITKAEEAAQKKKDEIQQGTKGVQDLQGELQAGTAGNDRRLFEAYVKAEMDVAKRKSKAGNATYGQTQVSVARARKEATEKFKDFQAGKGQYDLSNSNLADDVEDQNEAAVKQMGNDLARARGDIITQNVEAANKVLERQQGLSSHQLAAAREGLKVAEKLAREQALQGAELEEIRQWQESVARFANANQESGNRRRAQRNSS